LRSTVIAIVFTAAALAAPGHARAQEVVPLRLTLGDAVDRARALGEEVEQARAQQQLAESQVVQARSGALPQVSANLFYTRTLATIFDQIRLPFPVDNGNGNGNGFLEALPFGRPNIWNATIQVSQPVWAGGRVATALELARNVRRAAALQVDEAEAEITLQVRNAYFQLLLAQDVTAIAEEAYRLADAHLKQVELFRQQGTASDFDVLRARVERDNLDPPIIEARNARRLADLNLKRLINVDAARPIVATTPIDPVLADLDREALRAAMRRRSALQALDEVVAAREGAVRLARANRLPSIDLSGNFSFQAFPDSPIPFDANWRRDWAVTVQMSVPIFTGARIGGEIGQAQAELQQARLERSLVAEGLEIELEAALGEFEAARAQIEARRATVGQARRALELAELRFRTGLATQLEISDARLLLQQSQLNEAQALSAYITALARLERAGGGEIPLVAPRLATGETSFVPTGSGWLVRDKAGKD
jgi:outer membrane protein